MHGPHGGAVSKESSRIIAQHQRNPSCHVTASVNDHGDLQDSAVLVACLQGADSWGSIVVNVLMLSLVFLAKVKSRW